MLLVCCESRVQLEELIFFQQGHFIVGSSAKNK